MATAPKYKLEQEVYFISSNSFFRAKIKEIHIAEKVDSTQIGYRFVETDAIIPESKIFPTEEDRLQEINRQVKNLLGILSRNPDRASTGVHFL